MVHRSAHASPSRGLATQAYDIRLLDAARGDASVYPTIQASDGDAIRRALRLTPEGGGVEVWRGMQCVYSSEGFLPRAAV